MPRHADDDDDPEDDLDRDDPGEWDVDSEDADEESATDTCPYCGAEIYEGAPRCPRCGKYLSEEDAPRRQRPAWVWVAIILAFIAIATWILW